MEVLVLLEPRHLMQRRDRQHTTFYNISYIVAVYVGYEQLHMSSHEVTVTSMLEITYMMIVLVRLCINFIELAQL